MVVTGSERGTRIAVDEAVEHILGFVLLNDWSARDLQAYEYVHAYSDLNLKLSTGVFGSTFFMLTGFHGFHVTLGVTMLIAAIR